MAVLKESQQLGLRTQIHLAALDRDRREDLSQLHPRPDGDDLAGSPTEALPTWTAPEARTKDEELRAQAQQVLNLNLRVYPGLPRVLEICT